jgi:CheY-like chemotaxis protein
MNKKVILVVEDEKTLQYIIQTKLEESGIEVVTARSVAQAEKLLSEHKTVDAIWLDHYLVGNDNGLDLVARLKSDKKRKHIPIFVVSNSASEDKICSYIKLGIERYYAKMDYKLADIVQDVAECIEG